MRLLSLTVRNYRIHREIAVKFDRARNLLGGPNGSGKSTLAEAAHRALFLRAKSGGAVQTEMVSSIHHGTPEVVLAFEAGGLRWEIEKRFAAAKGTARLTNESGQVFKDDEAETKLAELLKSEASGKRVTAGQLPSLWAHLWVWQGSSGKDPGEHANPYRDTLVQRLQKEGVGAVMQSATDQRVLDRIAKSYEELFTTTGKARAGSPPELARGRLEAAVESHRLAAEAADRLESAIADLAVAEQEIAAAAEALPGLKRQLTEADAKAGELAGLREKEQVLLRAWEAADLALKQVAASATQIDGLKKQAQQPREALQPAEAKETKLVLTEEQSAGASREAEGLFRKAADALRQQRLRHDLAAAMVAAFEKENAWRALEERSKEVAGIQRERTALQAELSKLPPLAAKDLDALRKLDREAGQASAALSAMATSVELVAADQPVSLDGQPLAVGRAIVLPDTGDLVIGKGTRLRITPGGGTSLSAARAKSAEAARALADALARHTLADLDAASSAFERRRGAEQQLAQLDTRWKALGGETIAAALEAALAHKEAARAEVDRRRDALDGEHALVTPASPEEATRLLGSARETLQAAEKAEASARARDETSRRAWEKATRTLQEHRADLVQARQMLRDLETRVRTLEETHGDDAARESATTRARVTEAESARKLAAAREAIAAFSPDLLAADQQRLRRAIEQQEARHRSAEDRRLAARTRLQLDGSSDPQAELLHARARLDRAQEAHDSEQRRAKAIEHLHRLFERSRESIDRALVQPLASRISAYLECIYGPGTAANLVLSDQGIADLELLRAGQPAFGFAVLSGGEKEQVAAAVRLAMAEILAAEHDGCLPLVFDDAFAYSDPERVQLLQRMLDLAATRGLQVIVLACTPADYSSLGAVEIRVAG